MAVSITQVRRMAVELLNQSDPSSGYGTITAERYKSGEIDDWILAADASIMASILNATGSTHREPFLTDDLDVAYGEEIPDHEGPIESVVFVITGGPLAGTRHAKKWEVPMVQELDRENLNELALTRLFPHYVLENDTIYHNAEGLELGGAASVVVNVRYAPALTVGQSPQSPDAFLKAVALSSLAALFLKDGQRESAGQVFEQMLEAELARLLKPAEATAA